MAPELAVQAAAAAAAANQPQAAGGAMSTPDGKGRKRAAAREKQEDAADGKAYRCAECNKGWAGPSGLWYHMKHVHQCGPIYNKTPGGSGKKAKKKPRTAESKKKGAEGVEQQLRSTKDWMAGEFAQAAAGGTSAGAAGFDQLPQVAPFGSADSAERKKRLAAIVGPMNIIRKVAGDAPGLARIIMESLSANEKNYMVPNSGGVPGSSSI